MTAASPVARAAPSDDGAWWPADPPADDRPDDWPDDRPDDRPPPPARRLHGGDALSPPPGDEFGVPVGGPAAPAGPPPDPPLAVEYTVLGRGGVKGTRGEFGFTQLDLAYRVDAPPVGRWAVAVTPQFSAVFLDGPTRDGPDLPPQVFGLGVDVQAQTRLSDRLGLRVGATPGLYTDFDEYDDAFRVPARAVFSYTVSPQLTLLGGAAYTSLPSIPVVPVAGLVWSPSEQWALELGAPRTRVTYRWSDRLSLYGQLGFAGGVFAVRANGRADLLQYSDFRPAFGAEWAGPDGAAAFVEVGGAFNRELDFDRQPDRDVGGGFYLRVGTRF